MSSDEILPSLSSFPVFCDKCSTQQSIPPGNWRSNCSNCKSPILVPLKKNYRYVYGCRNKKRIFVIRSSLFYFFCPCCGDPMWNCKSPVERICNQPIYRGTAMNCLLYRAGRSTKAWFLSKFKKNDDDLKKLLQPPVEEINDALNELKKVEHFSYQKKLADSKLVVAFNRVFQILEVELKKENGEYADVKWEIEALVEQMKSELEKNEMDYKKIEDSIRMVMGRLENNILVDTSMIDYTQINNKK